jgi:hypothetical protein
MANGGDTGDTDDGNRVPELLDAIFVVSEAIAMADNALKAGNPTVEQERALNRLLLRLNAEFAVLDAELTAALDEDTSVKGPTEAQLAQIGALSDEVELLKNRAATVSARIALATKVLEVASKVLPSAALAPA